MQSPETYPAAVHRPICLRKRCLVALAALCLALAVSGCSLRVSYPYMDWWLSWKVGNYISLNREQQQHLQSTLDQFQRWHQHTQLPAYARELDALQTQLQKPGLTPGQLQNYRKQSEKHWLASLDYALPDVTKMFMTVSDAQWQQFTQAVIEKTGKDTQPYLEGTAQEQHKRRQRQLEKGAKSWLGNVSPQQRQLIRQWSTEMHNLAAVRRLEQQRWVEHVDQLYRQRQTLATADLQSRLRHLMAEETSFWLPEHARLLEENRQRTLQLLCDLHASLSDNQRRHMLQRLSEVQHDLLYLYRKTLPA